MGRIRRRIRIGRATNPAFRPLGPAQAEFRGGDGLYHHGEDVVEACWTPGGRARARGDDGRAGYPREPPDGKCLPMSDALPRRSHAPVAGANVRSRADAPAAGCPCGRCRQVPTRGGAAVAVVVWRGGFAPRGASRLPAAWHVDLGARSGPRPTGRPCGRGGTNGRCHRFVSRSGNCVTPGPAPATPTRPTGAAPPRSASSRRAAAAPCRGCGSGISPR